MPSIDELAAEFGCRVDGDGSIDIIGVAGLREARNGELSFLTNRKYAGLAASTRASAVLVEEAFDGDCNATLLRCDNPDAVFAKLAMRFARMEPEVKPGIHPSAVIHDSAEIGENVHIGPLCVIEEGAVIGDGSILRAQVYVGYQAQIGRDCKLYPNVSVREFCELGDRVIIHNNTVIGSEGFGYSVDAEGHRVKIPQTGIAVVGDDSEIGACVTLDRARFGQTRIGKHVKIDNLVQIAHNVVVGDDAVLIAQVGIAGSTVIGKKAILAGQVGVNGHVEIGEGAIVAAKSGVTKDIKPGAYVWGYPAEPFKDATRSRSYVGQIPKLKDRIASLECRLQELLDKTGEA